MSAEEEYYARLNAEAAENKAEQKVLAKGQKKAAGIKIGTDVAMGGIRAILRQMQINKIKRAQEADRRAMAAPIMTDKMLAEASAIQDSMVRQAKALEARGSSTGAGGIDSERMRLARDAGLKKAAMALSARQGGELKRRQILAQNAANRAQDINKRIDAQHEGIMSDATKILSDKAVVNMLGQAGKKKREGKTTDIGTDTKSLESEVSGRIDPKTGRRV